MSATAASAAASGAAYDIDVSDVEYLKHGDTSLLARIYRPIGVRDDGAPFPMMVDLHGGAWCQGDRNNDKVLCEAMARNGIVVAALDFRQPPDAGYPASVQDINFGVRWLKANAGRFGGTSDRIGIFGISSGGQQAMLVAMRPRDPRYAAIERPGVTGVDASVGCVVMCWPVIDPLGRYQYGKELLAAGGDVPANTPRAIPSHDQYWGTEDAMSEGSPVRILERGEDVRMPPAFYIQGDADRMHPREHLDRFVELYRAKGGSVDLALYEGEAEGFITREPKSMENQIEGTGRIIAFIHEQLS